MRLALALALLAPVHAQDAELVAPPELASKRREATDERKLVVYDISDLTGQEGLRPPLPADPGEVDEARAKELLEAIQEREAELERIRARAEDLAAAVGRHVEPPLPDGDAGPQLINNGAMLLQVTDAQHEWVRTFLELQRRKAMGMLVIESRMLTVPAGTMETLGMRSSAKVIPSAEEFAQLLEQAQSRPGAELVVSPRIAVRPGQRANLSVLNQVAYIKDYELVVVEPDEVEIADPVIDVVQEGILVDLKTIALTPDTYGISVELTQSTLARPIPTKTLRIGARRAEVTIGLPEVTTLRMSSDLALGVGASAVLVTPDPVRTRVICHKRR